MTLNPTQGDIRTGFLDIGGDRPTFDRSLGRDLHEYIESSLKEDLPADPEHQRLTVRKATLEAVHSCELRWLNDEWTGWTVPMLRGTVSHRAIERLVLGGYRDEPLDLVNMGLEYLTAEDQTGELAEFLRGLDPEERHELIVAGTNDVTTFLADWPPIAFSWKPRLEHRRKYDRLFGGMVSLTGKYDLMLGVPNGMEARAFIGDLKTGKLHESHAADVRFYALLEVLRQGVPPFRVGSYYLDTGSYRHEDVTEDLLYLAASRLVDGIRKMWEVRSGVREPEARASGLCTYCPLHSDCATGITFMAEQATRA